MKEFTFNLQRFSVMPTLLSGEDGGGVRYWNTIPGAEVTGFGNTFFVNHGAGCVIYCDGNNTKVYNDTVAPNVIINGAGGRDWLINDAVNVEIYGNAGNDDLLSYANNCKLNGGEDDDAIQNRGGSNVKIYGGENDDWINNTGNKVTIDAGDDEGCDTVENYGESVEISTKAGMDFITNYGSKVSIEAGVGNDEIHNANGKNIFIDAGKGADSIYVEGGSFITVEAGNEVAKDYVENHGENVSISTGKGNDTIGNFGSKVSILSGADNDSIKNTGSNVSINAGTGNNIIKNGNYEGHTKTTYIHGGTPVESFIVDESVKGGSNVTIIADDSDDKIYNFGGLKVSINAGAGKNLVSVYGGNNISIESGEGDDSIYATGKGKNITINSGKGRNLISVGSGRSYVTINGGNDSEGIDGIFNAADNALIKGGKGNDYIKNSGDYAIVSGGADGDIIQNYGNNAYISGDEIKGGKGSNDYIYTDKGSDVTIDGGEGDDLIEAWHDVAASISGGDGNDRIHLYRVSTSDKKNILWKAGKTVALDVLSKYNKVTKAFSDVLSSLSSAKDILNSFYTAENIGDFLKGTTLAVGNLFFPVSSILEIKSYVEELNNTESTINGGIGDDVIIADGFAPRVFEYKTGDGKDSLYHFNETRSDDYLSTIHITEGTIKKINLDNVKIAGSDVMINVGKGSIRLVSGDDKKFKIRESDGKTTTLAYKCDPDRGDTICSIFGGAEDETIKDTISGAVYRNALYGGGGDDLLLGTVKDDTLDGGDGSNKLYGNKGNDVLYSGGGKNLFIGGDGNDTIYAGLASTDSNLFKGSHDTVDAGADDDYIVVSGYNPYGGYSVAYQKGYVSVDAGSGNDTIRSVSDNNTIIGGEDNDSISTSGKKTLFLYADGDGKDSIKGIGESDTLEVTKGLISSAKVSGKNVIFTIGEGSVKLINAVNKKFNLREADGTLTTRAYSKDSGGEVVCSIFGSAKGETLMDNVGINRQSEKDPIIGTINKNVIYGYGGKDTLCANDKDSTLYGGSSNDLLLGGDGNDKLYGESGKDTLSGGGGKDTLSGGAGNDSLSGGKGNDILKGGKGNDTLLGGDDNDKLYGDDDKDLLGGGKGNDTLYGGKGNDTILGGKNNDKLYGDDDNDSLEGGTGNDTLYGGKGNDKLLGGLNDDELYGGEGKDTLLGDDGKDYLSGGKGNDCLKGGAGDDTLSGDAGNNKLWGDEGADTFICGNGNDIIYGFENSDTLRLDNIDFETSVSKKGDVIKFKFEDGSVTLRNFSATTFHVKDGIYQINDFRNFVKK